MHIYTIKKLLHIPQFKITKIRFIEKTKLLIYIESYKRKKFICSECSNIETAGYHSTKESTVRDLAWGEFEIFIRIKKRRFHCSKCNCIRTERIDWLAKTGRATKRYAEKVNNLTAITTNQEAGWFLNVDDEFVQRIDKEILQEKAKKKLDPIPVLTNGSVDEVSYRKYHNYLTIVVDADKRKVIWGAKGRTKKVLNKYYKSIGKKKCFQIESMALDGAKTYIGSTEANAKNALVVYDKFHLVQKINNTIDTVRKQELKKARIENHEDLETMISCKRRFILLKKKSKLSDKQKEYLEKIFYLNEPICKGMILKDDFLDIYECKDFDEAKIHFENWLEKAKKSGLTSFIELAEKLNNKKKYILNWFVKKISSAISEGMNNKIKRLKRMAYGYKDIDYFLLKIHQHCGLLSPRQPT